MGSTVALPRTQRGGLAILPQLPQASGIAVLVAVVL